MWKYHKKTPCSAILNKQKCHHFTKTEQEGKTGPFWGIGASGKRKDVGKG
jgi:hypothetical protein